MNQEPEQSKDHVETIWMRLCNEDIGVGLLILGILFTIVWIGACVFFACLALMADVMTFGPGISQAGANAGMILQLVALVIAAIAGIQGGRAFYRTDHRKRLLARFGWLLLAGVLIFISSFIIAGAF